MKITKGEYCQFTLQGKTQLLHLYGKVICRRTIEDKAITIFRVFDFYVEVIYNEQMDNLIMQAEPVSQNLINFYKSTDDI